MSIIYIHQIARRKATGAVGRRDQLRDNCLLRCVGFVWNGLRILELAARGDKRVYVKGDVTMDIRPLRPRGVRFAPYSSLLNTVLAIFTDHSLLIVRDATWLRRRAWLQRGRKQTVQFLCGVRPVDDMLSSSQLFY